MASSSTERVNQHLPTSLLPASHHCVAATLRPPPSPTQPIRFLPSTQPLKPDVSDWMGKGGLHAGQGRGVPHSLFLSLSPSECFSLTVCDSSWMGDCSHTLSPPMVDHIPRLPHLTPPHHSPPTLLLPTSRTAHGTVATFIFKRTPFQVQSVFAEHGTELSEQVTACV